MAKRRLDDSHVLYAPVKRLVQLLKRTVHNGRFVFAGRHDPVTNCEPLRRALLNLGEVGRVHSEYHADQPFEPEVEWTRVLRSPLVVAEVAFVLIVDVELIVVFEEICATGGNPFHFIKKEMTALVLFSASARTRIVAANRSHVLQLSGSPCCAQRFLANDAAI